MITTVLMILQTLTGPTLEDITQLPPGAAGDLALKGQRHEPIVAVQEVESILQLPYPIELQLIERPIASDNGCLRNRWRLFFQGSTNIDPAQAVLARSYSMVEIALSDSAGCPSKDYVHLNPNVEPREGFASLVALEEIRSGARKPQFSCSDQTSSDLCFNAQSIRRELMELPVWAASSVDGGVELWLGRTGHIVTAVRLDFDDYEFVEVERRIPAPH